MGDELNMEWAAKKVSKAAVAAAKKASRTAAAKKVSASVKKAMATAAAAAAKKASRAAAAKKASASVKKAATSMSLRRRRTWGKSVSKAAKGSNKDEDLEDELNLEWAAKKVSCSALKAHKAALQGAIAAYKKAPASKKK